MSIRPSSDPAEVGAVLRTVPRRITMWRHGLHLLAAGALVLASGFPAAKADLLPPQAVEAEQRLRQNPNAFDRVDAFCAGRKVGAACTLSGDALAGGGAGVCRNGLDVSRRHIDLRCERRAQVTIDRGLSAGGFTLPASVCADPEGAEVVRRQGHACTPPAQPPQDRFCAGRAVGAACTAELTVDGQPVRNAGVCSRVTESAPRFYFRGWQVAQREVVQCVSAKPVAHDMKPLSWWQKVRQ
jgi:hypothetical protein